MATVPSPKTWVALEDVSAAELNLELRDAVNFLLNRPSASVNRTAATSPAHNTVTVVTLDAEVYDTDTMWAAGAPTRMIAKTAGKYLVTSQVTFATNSTGVRYIYVEKNAAGAHDTAKAVAVSVSQPNATTSTTALVASTVVLAANDYLEMFIFQNSGAGLAIVPGDRNTYLEMTWMSI